MSSQGKKTSKAKTTKKSATKKSTTSKAPTKNATSKKVDAHKRRIIKKCKEAGTYNVAFTITIDLLAQTLAIRDDAYQKFLEGGGNTVVEHTPDRGEVANLVKNPALVIVRDFTTLAMSYLKELGLTPKEADKIAGLAADKPADAFMRGLEELDIL